MKLGWTNHWVFSAAAGADNDNVNSNNISFTIKDTKLYALVITFSAKNNQKLSKLLRKDLKDQFIGMIIKQKVRIKRQEK